MASLIPDFRGVSIDTAGAMRNYVNASNNVATAMNKPFDRITALVESNELARKNKLAEERQAAQDARQVIADQQNKQIFDLKMEDANRAKQDLIDKDEYLKGMVDPNAYGLKAGTEDIVNWLGNYTGDDAIAQAGIAAGPGTPEYEALFKRNEDIGNYITGKSLDDRTIGFSTANPNNRYAAEEMMKATISRQNALDKEAKDVADAQLKYQLESLKQSGKGSTGVSGDGTSTSKVGMTAGGYKVSSPDDVLKDANTIMKDNYGLKSDSPMDARVVKLASRMANNGYSASQIAEVIGTNYTPGKTQKLFGLVDSLWPDKAAVFNDIAPNVGAPKNVAVQPTANKEYTDTLSGLSQSYADRLAKIQQQRDGTYGIDKIRELINGPAQGSASVSKSNDGKTLTERINNPGAIKQADKGDKSVMWKGQTGYDDQGHAVFDTVENGFRAQAINLNTQISKQPTIEELIKGNPEKGIGAYATGNQNEYVKFISDKLGADKNYTLKPDDIPRLLKAQSQFEGSAFNETAANTGYQMAVEEGKIKVTPKTAVQEVVAKVEESSNSKGKDAQGVLDYYNKKREEIANIKTNAWDRTVNAVTGGPTVDDGYGKLTGKSYSKDISTVSDALRKDGFSSAEDIAILASNMPEGKDKEAVANVLHYKQMQSDPEYRQLMKEQQINDAAWLAADTILAAVPIGKLVGSVARRVGGSRISTTALPNGLAGTTGREAMKIGVTKAATEKAAAKAAIERRIAGLEHDLQQVGGELSKNRVGSGMTRSGLEKDFAAIRKAQKELQNRLKGL